MIKRLKFSIYFLLMGLSTTSFATDLLIIAPSCLLKPTSIPHKILAKKDDLRLIRVKEESRDVLIAAKHRQGFLCGGFMDVTDAHLSKNKRSISDEAFLTKYSANITNSFNAPEPYEVRYEKDVNQALQQLNPQDMWQNLAYLTSQKDRYANSTLGVATAHWLKEKVGTLAKANNRKDVTVYLVNTGRYKQPSVVAKIGSSQAPGVVVGAHMDTLDSLFSIKPGADDDGSGTVTVLETLRTIFASNLQFKKPIYFVWYAAEEMGLVGSGYVVKDFKAKNIPVAAVIHFDTTGFVVKKERTMWLITDHVNQALTKYLATLIKTYVTQKVDYTRCGYACSDHASWTAAGFPAAMPAETAFAQSNPDLHTARDTMDKLSLDHMTDYAKLGVAFVIEMGEPTSA